MFEAFVSRESHETHETLNRFRLRSKIANDAMSTPASVLKASWSSRLDVLAGMSRKNKCW